MTYGEQDSLLGKKNQEYFQNEPPSYDIVEEERNFGTKFGALGDCCGCNRPFDHSAARRNQLIRRVFIILLIQLLIVLIMSLIAMFVQPVNNLFSNPTFIITSWIIAIVLEFSSLIALFFFREKFPFNFIILFIFTISSGFFVALCAAVYDVLVVIEAFAITSFIVTILIIYTLVSRTDFHFLGAFLSIGIIILLVWTFAWIIGVLVFHIAMYWLHQIICLFGILLFCGYLLFDVSNLVHDYTPDDYILVAVNIYLDILNIFLYILACLSAGSNN